MNHKFGFLSVASTFVIAALSSSSIAEARFDTLRQRLSEHKLVAAHQGGIFDGTPNTLALFKTAKQKGADIVEMDLRMSKDGIPVVFHDETLEKMTNCQGKVIDFTVEELKKCEFKFIFSGGEISTFEEVLEWNKGDVILNAEFKVNEVVEPAIHLVEKYQAFSSTYFQTKGDPKLYSAARAVSSEVALLFAPGDLSSLDWALSLGDDNLVVIEIHENLRTKALIDRIHEANKWVSENSWHWRYDQEFLGVSCAKGFYEFGLDILVSNRPGACVKDRVAR